MEEQSQPQEKKEKMTFNDLVARLPAIIDKSVEARIGLAPVHVNRASMIGHPCTKYLVHYRLDSKQRKLFTIETQKRVERGNLQEPIAKERLYKDGKVVISNQWRDYDDKSLQITGHIDGIVESIDGEEIKGGAVLEIKTVTPYIKVRNLQDLIKNKYYCRYPGQTCMYMYLGGKENGLIALYEPVANDFTYITFNFYEEIDYINSLVNKCKEINEHVKNETYPEVKFLPDFCPECEFEHICLPPRIYEGSLEIIDDPEILELLNQYASCEAEAGFFKECKDKLRGHFKGLEGTRVCGNFVVVCHTDGRGFKMIVERKGVNDVHG